MIARRRTRKDSLNVSLSTHLFAFHDLDEAIFPLYPRYGFTLAEIWAMPPHFPSGDFTAADAVARRMASLGIRVASVHAPLYPDVRTYKKDRWYSLSSVDEAHRLRSVAATGRAAGWLAGNGGGTVVLHTSFPAGQWYPHRWSAFLSSMNELLDAVPAGVRFAVENTPVDSGQVAFSAIQKGYMYGSAPMVMLVESPSMKRVFSGIRIKGKCRRRLDCLQSRTGRVLRRIWRFFS